jgi:hypothetical protein
MPKQLSFTEEFRYADDLSGISIPVVLSYGDRSRRVQAKVDTGGEVCLFSREEGTILGLPIDQGTPITLSSIGGNVEAFGHEITMQTGELIFQSMVYFAKHPGLPRNILGRRGWLRNLKLGVVDYDNLLYLSAYDS